MDLMCLRQSEISKSHLFSEFRISPSRTSISGRKELTILLYWNEERCVAGVCLTSDASSLIKCVGSRKIPYCSAVYLQYIKKRWDLLQEVWLAFCIRFLLLMAILLGMTPSSYLDLKCSEKKRIRSNRVRRSWAVKCQNLKPPDIRTTRQPHYEYRILFPLFRIVWLVVTGGAKVLDKQGRTDGKTLRRDGKFEISKEARNRTVGWWIRTTLQLQPWTKS